MTRARILKIWDQLESSYWFRPMIMTALAVAAAFSLTAMDRNESWPSATRWVYRGQPDSARVLLATVASSMITIATLTFSITIVALTLASNQFGSRLLYSFMRDRANQLVLGEFAAAFTYCIIVLQSVRSSSEQPFVPQTAVTVAVGLAIAGIPVLIFFIHHVASSIQASSVIAAVREDMCESIERFFPEPNGDGTLLSAARVLEELPVTGKLAAASAGVLQAIDLERMLEIACEEETCFRLLRRPGDYIIEGASLVELRGQADLGEEHRKEVRELFILGSRRTLIQDVEFALLQLVEIALRALSPGINDPFTACACLEELGSGLARIMQKGKLRAVETDKEGRPRLVLDVTSFAGITEAAFNQIRQHGGGDVAVTIKLLEVLTELATLASDPEHVAAFKEQAEACFSAAMKAGFEQLDESAIQERYAQFKEASDRGRG